MTSNPYITYIAHLPQPYEATSNNFYPLDTDDNATFDTYGLNQSLQKRLGSPMPSALPSMSPSPMSSMTPIPPTPPIRCSYRGNINCNIKPEQTFQPIELVPIPSSFPSALPSAFPSQTQTILPISSPRPIPTPYTAPSFNNRKFTVSNTSDQSIWICIRNLPNASPSELKPNTYVNIIIPNGWRGRISGSYEQCGRNLNTDLAFAEFILSASNAGSDMSNKYVSPGYDMNVDVRRSGRNYNLIFS